MKLSSSFTIALLALLGEAFLAWHGKPTGGLTTIAGLYIGSRQAAKASHGWAASKDPNCNTSEIIEKINN